MGNFDIGTTQYQYWLLQVSTFGKFPKMPHKLLKVLANTYAIIEISFISLIGYSNTHYLVCILGNFYYFPLIFGSLAVKTSGNFRNFVIIHHKPSVDHCFVQVLCQMYGQTLIFPILPPYFGSLVIKAVAIVKISSFTYFILCLCIVTFKLFILVWLIGIKTNGNYRNFVIFTCFVCSIMCYVYSNTKKLMLFPHWFGSLAVNARQLLKFR